VGSLFRPPVIRDAHDSTPDLWMPSPLPPESYYSCDKDEITTRSDATVLSPAEEPKDEHEQEGFDNEKVACRLPARVFCLHLQ